MNTFFSADFHYNHGNIIKYCNRPFLSELEKANIKYDPNFRVSQASIELMNDTIVDSVNKTVGKNDQLYFLGDWSFAKKHEYYLKAKELRDRINCENIYLILGNHDSDVISNLFKGCYDLKNVVVNKQRIVLCHYAMAVWDQSHRGAWQLYGHSHAVIEEWMEEVIPNRFSMDVGVDNAYRLLGEYRPFSFDDIMDIFKKKNT